jgi:hypothetical protein
MALNRIYIEVSGERDLIRRIENVAKNISDSTERNRKIYEEFWKPKMRRVFDTEGAENGQRWKELSDAYAAQKLKRYGSQTINRATERLGRSLYSETADTVKDIDKFTATFGSSVPYFKYVNKVRPIVVVTEKDKREIGIIFKRDIEGFIRGQGL